MNFKSKCKSKILFRHGYILNLKFYFTMPAFFTSNTTSTQPKTTPKPYQNQTKTLHVSIYNYKYTYTRNTNTKNTIPKPKLTDQQFGRKIHRPANRPKTTPKLKRP